MIPHAFSSSTDQQTKLQNPLLIDEATPLAGREVELDKACRVLGATSRPAGVLLTGVTGIGKSRLADEIVSLHGQDAVDVDPALQEVLRTPEAVGFLEKTIARAVRLRLLLRVDNAHLLDPAAVPVLLQAVCRQHVRLLAEINLDAGGTGAGDALCRSPYLHTIHVGPLDASTARRLAGYFSGHRISQQCAARLADLSAGNPSVLREIIRALQNERPASIFGDSRLVIPESVVLRKLADARIAVLETAPREALELIALAEPARLTAVEELVDPDVLVSLEDRRLIITNVDDAMAHITVADPLLGHVLRQETGPLRRKQLLASWKTALPENERQPDEYVRIVSWEQQSGHTPSEGRLLQACRYALSRHDLPTATHLARVAWRTYRSASAADLYGQALLASASLDDLHKLCLEAVEKDDAEVGLALQPWRARAWILGCDYAQAEAAISEMQGPAKELLAALSDYFQGRYQDCLHRCSPLLATASPAMRVEATVFAMSALCHLGRPLDALALYEDAARAMRSEDDVWAPHTDSLEELRACALHLSGDLRGAQDVLEQEYGDAARRVSFRTDTQRGLALGFTLYERGLVRRALAHFVLSPAYQVGWEQWHARAGIYAELASNCLPDSQRKAPHAPLDTLPSGHYTHLAIVRAHRAMSRGDQATALALLQNAVRDAQAQGAGTDVAIIVHEMARIGLASDTRAQWSVAVQGPYLQARLQYAQALATGDHALMKSVARSFAAAGAELYAAEAYAEISRMRRRTGDSGAAAAAVAAARAHLGACDPVQTPALRFLDQPASLSTRERTIAGLAAEGLSDKEIAEQLVLSPRTVSNTLYRVYQKLDIPGRRHLRQLLEASAF
ncbi:LuxR C-terminal-related transcriptional regulator [Streptomyces sp. NPDC000987]|uniref:LuxR C-terminal-related transcriptional regulator n=1 Tax=Streptomyces sp. NPDC000987 TaxID=3154374 RepID=UPI00332231FF